ncbi:hypothetical protein ASF43_15460 [Pseudorhodoferax sp. Leaf267]|nr:hypothetical protein ASF43_15460 [Pseudorhodoferax sp. Leaf267]
MLRALHRSAIRCKVPWAVALEVLARDARCVYCAKLFCEASGLRSTFPTWDSLNAGKKPTVDDVVLCCIGCKASKGRKPLRLWLQSGYCRQHNIELRMFAPVALRHVKHAADPTG